MVYKNGVRAARSTALLASVLTLAACGGDESLERQGAAPPATEVPAETTPSTDSVATTAPPGAELARRPSGEDGLRVAARRAQLIAKGSDFGTVLFDANGQVVYAFEQDRAKESNCTDAECVEAWPPVLTEEEPTAGAGVDASLLGTIRRSDGSRQVTYAGRPLYFYEHEGPGDIRCHNVNLHGGLWWVVTPSGENAA